VPSHKFLRSHKTADWQKGLRTRWNGYRYDQEYFNFNPKLWLNYNIKHFSLKKIRRGAFGENGFIDLNLTESNCPGAYYFPPQRETRDDVILATNHYIIPEMRLSTMHGWTSFINSIKDDKIAKTDDIQWRYDKLNYLILKELARGPIDYDNAKSLVDFLSPCINKYGPDCTNYFANNPSKNGFIRIEGSNAICDLKKKTMEGHYGYFKDEWVKITLPNY
jgi:hypothetical protein